MTEEELTKTRQIVDVSWKLANDCLDILPASDLAVTGYALVHLVSIWLNAMPEEGRVKVYLKWLENLHVQLRINGVLNAEVIEAAINETGVLH
jgi:hypothetical protein